MSWSSLASGCWATRPTGSSGPHPGDDGDEELYVARLEPMIAPELQRLIVEGQRLAVPAADRERFLAEFGAAAAADRAGHLGRPVGAAPGRGRAHVSR